jgi:hypothetical protein
MLLVEACRRIERNEPPIKSFTFNLRANANEGVVVELYANYAHLSSNEGDVFDDPDVWRRLGSAIKSNPTLQSFGIDYGEGIMGLIQSDHPLAAACLEAFYDELKDNKSIEDLHLNEIDLVLPMFNLGYFLQQNTSMKYLKLGKLMRQDGLMTREQGHVMASALRDVELECLNIEDLRFVNNNEAFHEIVSACTRVNNLAVRVRFTENSQVAAIASLLRDPNALLQTLTIAGHGPRDGVNFCRREIAASLVGNIKLKSLYMSGGAPMDIFDNLLCDSSSLTTICDSNHTLERIRDSSMRLFAAQ